VSAQGCSVPPSGAAGVQIGSLCGARASLQFSQEGRVILEFAAEERRRIGRAIASFWPNSDPTAHCKMESRHVTAASVAQTITAGRIDVPERCKMLVGSSAERPSFRKCVQFQSEFV
jgi:hypothetical protein